MPEILTESFCERCGTRYTFESAAPRSAKLQGVKVFSRGIKNFVLSDDSSIDEAMAAARSDAEREISSQQLDAFHKTFNFCMNCRQYTCGNCWNEAEGRCLSCAPHLGHEILPAPFPNLPPDGALILGGSTAAGIGIPGTNGHVSAEPPPPLAWPTSDLVREADAEEPAIPTGPAAEAAATFDAIQPPVDASPDLVAPDVDVEPIEEIDAVARLTILGALGASAVPEAPTVATPDPAGESGLIGDAAATVAEPAAAVTEAPTAAPATPAAAPAADSVAARAAAAAAQTQDLLHRFRPGQSLDAEIEAFEAQQAAAMAGTEAPNEEVAPDAAAPTAEVAAAAAPEPEPEPVAAAPEPEPEPVAAAPEPEPEPVAAAPEPELLPPAIGIAAATAAASADAAPLAPAASASPVEAPAPVEPVAPRVDVVPQPTWQIVAPDIPPAAPPAAAVPPIMPTPAAPPTAPAAEPQWPTAGSAAFLTAKRSSGSALDSLWAESAREVTAAVPMAAASAPADARPSGVAPCVSCGLSLSATARFCRRCGTRQG